MCPCRRLNLATEMIRGNKSVTLLADGEKVSRKYAYTVKKKAHGALTQVFCEQGDTKPIFMQPMTKSLRDQFILCLVLNNHSSYLGVVKTFADLLDYKISPATVSNVVHKAIGKAKKIHAM